MIVCIGFGLSRYKHNDGQDDQINCLSILSILTKQRTYLNILSILMKQKDLFEHLDETKDLFVNLRKSLRKTFAGEAEEVSFPTGGQRW